MPPGRAGSGHPTRYGGRIEDCKVATAYAIEALRVFDHLHFRSRMKDAGAGKTGKKKKKKTKPEELKLKKPTAISSKPAWFEEHYVADSQKLHDQQLFGR